MDMPPEVFDDSEKETLEELEVKQMESIPAEEESENTIAFEPETIEGFDVKTSPNQKIAIILDKLSSIIIFLFRLILAGIANISIIIGIGILYSVYILIIGGVFFGIYYTVTGKSEKISRLNETVQDYLGGLRSTCTYINASSMKNMAKCTTFIRVSQQVNELFK